MHLAHFRRVNVIVRVEVKGQKVFLMLQLRLCLLLLVRSILAAGSALRSNSKENVKRTENTYSVQVARVNAKTTSLVNIFISK